MSDEKITEVVQSEWHVKWMFNGKFKWEFLDEHTFTMFKKDENCPALMSEAFGNVFDGKRWMKAMLVAQKSENAKMYMSLYMKTPESKHDDLWSTMTTITDIERTY